MVAHAFRRWRKQCPRILARPPQLSMLHRCRVRLRPVPRVSPRRSREVRAAARAVRGRTMRSRFTGDTGFRGALRAVMSRGQLSRVGLSSFEYQVFRGTPRPGTPRNHRCQHRTDRRPDRHGHRRHTAPTLQPPARRTPRRTVAPSAMIGLPPAPGRGEAAGFRHADRATFGRVGRLGGPTGERATRGRRVCRPTRAPPNVQR